MGVNSLPKTVTRQRRDCDLNPGPSVPESSTLTTRLLSSPVLSRTKGRQTGVCYLCGVAIRQLMTADLQHTLATQRLRCRRCFCVIQTWTDYRLKWNTSDFNGLELTSIHSSLMWTPDIYLVNT